MSSRYHRASSAIAGSAKVTKASCMLHRGGGMTTSVTRPCCRDSDVTLMYEMVCTQNTTQDLYVVHARTDLCKQIGTCARARTHTTQACVYVCACATSVLAYVCVCSERHTCRYTRNMLRSYGHLLAQPIDRHIQREAINHNSARACAAWYQGLLGSVLTAPIWSGRHPAWMPSVAYLPRDCASATCPAVLSSTMTPFDPGSTRRQCTRLI